MVSRFDDNDAALFDEVAEIDVHNARIAHSRLMPPRAAGVTIGSLIVIRRGVSTIDRPDLYMHELIHVEQYRIAGPARFLFRYLRDYVFNLWRMRSHRAAYLAIPAEREARERVQHWSQRQNSPECGVGYDRPRT
jgi:hypothetical protein